MEWSRLYASLPDDPRVQLVEDQDGAGWLLIQSFCYCTRAESDGFIPHTQVPRFGGTRLRQRVSALVREKLWLEADGGYVLDPMIWNEERNLSDRAERKRKADRERIAAKRAAARATQNGQQVSRDCSATGNATSRRDSRPPEKRREEQTPPYGPPRPLWPASVPDPEGEGDRSGTPSPTELAAYIAGIRATRGDWTAESIRRALLAPECAERGWARTSRAMLRLAGDPKTEQPGRLPHDGPWWRDPPAARTPGRTATCPVHHETHPATAKCRGCAADEKAVAS